MKRVLKSQKKNSRNYQRPTKYWQTLKSEAGMTDLDMRVLTLEVGDSHGINLAMELTSLTYLVNYLEEGREVEWEIYSHNSSEVVREDLTIEVMISDMILQ